jgi:hypothetical protein
MDWLRRRALVGGLSIAAMAVAFVMTLHLAPPAACPTIWALPDPSRPRDVDYLRSHNRQTSGNLNLRDKAVTNQFASSDPRNFASEVSLAEYAVAMSVPLTDAQSEFYGATNPDRRIIVVLSYGQFDEQIANGFAAQPLPPGGVHVAYQVRAAALDAQTGSLIFDQLPVCR